MSGRSIKNEQGVPIWVRDNCKCTTCEYLRELERKRNLPSDYEQCGYCGYDHEYEYQEAYQWHTEHPGEGYDTMHDINGKALHIGSDIHTFAYGLCKIKVLYAEHNTLGEGGSVIGVVTSKGEEVTVRTHEHKVTLVRTWKEMAHEALVVQNASNLSGVVRSFSIIISEVRERLFGEGKEACGTDAVNRHPVCVLFADKIAALTGTQSLGHEDQCGEAYQWARDLEGKN